MLIHKNRYIETLGGHRMKKCVFRLSAFVLVLLLLTNNLWAKEEGNYGSPLGIYEGEIGIKIISFSKNWASVEKLKTIYEELLENFHGEEIFYLSTIYIYPDSPDGVAGRYYEDYEIDNKGKYIYKKSRSIEIFNGNQYTDISQFARVLSHEYGHHFTLYYLLTGENKNFNQWKETDYAKIRGLLDNKDVEYFSVNTVEYIHEWDISEIAAEDYVQLFGSPTAKKSIVYKDVQERVDNNIKEYYYSTNSFNLLPQENLSIPLAADVPGLYLYWLELAGYTTIDPKLPIKPTLTIKKYKEVMPGYWQYEISWNPILFNDKEYEYTLVSYPAEDNNFPRPIKTVLTGEPMKAYIGSAINSNNKDTNRLILDDQYKGDYYFRLFIKDSKGFIFSTEPMKFNFGNEKKDSVYRMTDVPQGHWARESIQTVIDKKIAKGYEDGSYKPNNKITKAEFMTMLMRAIDYKVVGGKNNAHWFIKEGYFEGAKKLNLITTADYGHDYGNLDFDEAITREEVAFMVGKILKGLGYGESVNYSGRFSDTKNIKHKKEFAITTYYYIMDGYLDGTFKPFHTTTRAEAARIIYKLLDFTD